MKKINCFYKRGVSLTELMIVVAILAILVSFATLYYGGITNDMRLLKARQDLETIKDAIKRYRVDTLGQYPPSIDALVGKYLAIKPVDPWGSPYKIDTVNLEVYCVSKNTNERIARKYGLK
jgi:prepilin-type N-terminal cleavage/methylation domain-containing protein